MTPVTVAKNPGLAAVLSVLIPGIGQFYNGDFWRGIFWLILTPGMWIGTGGLLGWVCHVIASVTAYRRGEPKKSAGFSPQPGGAAGGAGPGGPVTIFAP